jgi:hypothetical protein
MRGAYVKGVNIVAPAAKEPSDPGKSTKPVRYQNRNRVSHGMAQGIS